MNNYVPAFSVTALHKKSSQILLVIPVINEGHRIRNQIKDIQESSLMIDVVIVDGGSTDGSLEDVEFYGGSGVTAILTKVGPGKLSAQLQIAFFYAYQNNYKYIITMDGNGKDGIGGIKEITQALEDGYDFVQGSRYAAGGNAINTPVLRTLAIKLLHAPLTSVAAGRKFTDTTNGFRGHSINLITHNDVAIFRPVFQTYELIFYLPIRASRLGLRTCEVPVIRTYPRNAPTPTKIKGVTAYFNLLKILYKSATGRYNPNFAQDSIYVFDQNQRKPQ